MTEDDGVYTVGEDSSLVETPSSSQMINSLDNDNSESGGDDDDGSAFQTDSAAGASHMMEYDKVAASATDDNAINEEVGRTIADDAANVHNMGDGEIMAPKANTKENLDVATSAACVPISESSAGASQPTLSLDTQRLRPRDSAASTGDTSRDLLGHQQDRLDDVNYSSMTMEAHHAAEIQSCLQPTTPKCLVVESNAIEDSQCSKSDAPPSTASIAQSELDICEASPDSRNANTVSNRSHDAFAESPTTIVPNRNYLPREDQDLRHQRRRDRQPG